MARSMPRSFRTKPMEAALASGLRLSMTASASAIWGTRLGFTKLQDSIRLRPAAAPASMRRTFSAVLNATDSFCSPSRAETSTMVTRGRPAPSPIEHPLPANMPACGGRPDKP